MSDTPYLIPQGWRDSLEGLREKVETYPEDPEDTALRDFVMEGSLHAAIYEVINDPDLEP